MGVYDENDDFRNHNLYFYIIVIQHGLLHLKGRLIELIIDELNQAVKFLS